jgi:hypothetical protein
LEAVVSGPNTRLSVSASSTTEGDPPPGRDLVRLAEHVAAGRVPFPTDLPADQADRLAGLVRGLCRDRLVRHIARAIAADLVTPNPAEEPPC